MGIGVFSYMFSTYASARAYRIPACLAAEVTRCSVSSALYSSLRRSVLDTSKRFISRDSRSFFVRSTITKVGGPIHNDKNVRLNIYPVSFRFERISLNISSIACLCLQVRRATEAVQRLCQCPSNKCSKLKVRKVGEGRYHIAGRNVFIRVSTIHLYI